MRPGLTTLRSIPAFRHLSDSVLGALDAISEIRTLEEDEVLCRQGETPQFLFYIVEGQIALSSKAPDGSSAVVEVIHPFGDSVLASVMANRHYVQTGYAVVRSRVLAIDAAALREMVGREASLGAALLASLSHDYRKLVRQIRDLKVRTAAQRLGAYLLALVPDPEAKTAEIRLPFEKGLLAARLGCRQENLSRAFAALRELGVETRGARVSLTDIPRLTEYAMPDYLTDPELRRLNQENGLA